MEEGLILNDIRSMLSLACFHQHLWSGISRIFMGWHLKVCLSDSVYIMVACSNDGLIQRSTVEQYFSTHDFELFMTVFKNSYKHFRSNVSQQIDAAAVDRHRNDIVSDQASHMCTAFLLNMLGNKNSLGWLRRGNPRKQDSCHIFLNSGMPGKFYKFFESY